MMMETALNIFLIVGYVTVVCYVAYKIMMFSIDKICTLIKKSKWFRVLVFLFNSILSVAVAAIKLEDYYSGKETGEVLFVVFVLLIASLFFLYVTFLAFKDKRGEIE